MATKKTDSDTIVAYKAFDKNWQCRGFQYEVGKSYVHDGDVSLCNSGFHACESPLDVLNYYSLTDSNFARVELDGVTAKKDGQDTKRAGRSIAVKVALSIADLISAQVEWTFKNADKTSVADGDYSTAASSGDYSTAACDTNGFACAAGLAGAVKGNAGSALSCGYQDAQGRMRIAVGYVGENGIKANTWYRADASGALAEVK